MTGPPAASADRSAESEEIPVAHRIVPWSARLDEVLADGRWHPRPEVLAVAAEAVPRDHALEVGRRRREWLQGRRLSAVAEPPTDEKDAAAGARKLVDATLGDMVRQGRVERRGARGAQEVRAVEDTAGDVPLADPALVEQVRRFVGDPRNANTLAVLRVLSEHDDGLTDAEVATSAGMNPNTAKHRRTALLHAGVVCRGGSRENRNGSSAQVWVTSPGVSEAFRQTV